MTKDLTLIILNYNTPELVAACLTSIKAFHLPKTQFKTSVVVVDNGSSDDSVKMLRKMFSWAEYIETGKNVGFAAGNNVALKQSKTQYNMLLNSDTELTKESNLDLLVTYMEAHPEVAVVTPKVILDSGALDMASHRGEPTPWAALTYFSKLAQLFPRLPLLAQYHQTYKDFTHIHFIDACSGAAMLVRKAAMDKVGLLDEAFFMYAEDLDWCFRFRQAGYQIVYNPESVIIHHKYQSGLSHNNSQVVKKTNAHFYDTMLQYYDKHYREQYPFFVRNLIAFFVNYKKAAA